MVSLDSVWDRMRELTTPLEPIEVSLGEAIGLVLAEPVVADVDLPPVDLAASDGYAVKAEEARPGVLLRVIAAPRDAESDYELDAGESALVEVGTVLPLGADSILAFEGVRSEFGSGGPRVVEVLQPADRGRAINPRGRLLRAGETLLPAGIRLTTTMVPLLASQGCVHPLCHRRVRVAILAIGDHLVNPTEAPILHRRRNSTNLALGTLITSVGAMVHDLGSVPESEAADALDRAMSAPVVLVIGELTGGLLRRLARDGVEPIATGIDYPSGESIQYGLIRDDRDDPVAHLLHLPLDPVEAFVATTLLALPLIARLQGASEVEPRTLRALLVPSDEAPDDETRPSPAKLSVNREGRLEARIIPMRSGCDLPALTEANAVLLPSARSRTDAAETLVDVVPIPGAF